MKNTDIFWLTIEKKNLNLVLIKEFAANSADFLHTHTHISILWNSSRHPIAGFYKDYLAKKVHSRKKAAKSGLDCNTCPDWCGAVIIQKVLCHEIDKTKHNYSFCSVWNKAPLQSPHVIQFVSLVAFVFCPNIQINHLPSNLKKHYENHQKAEPDKFSCWHFTLKINLASHNVKTKSTLLSFVKWAAQNVQQQTRVTANIYICVPQENAV